MPDRREAGRALTDALAAAERRKFRLVLTGRLLDDGTVTLADAPTNKCWVRYPYESREQTAVWGQVGGVNIPVYVGPSLDGGDEIKGIAWKLGTHTVGGALTMLAQAPHIGEVVGDSVTGLGFTPGRVEASTLGYPFIHVRSFDYDDGHWDDGSAIGSPSAYDFSIAPYVTAPSGYSQWIVVYFDPDAGVLLASANTPVYGDVSVLDEAQIDTSAIPAGMYPLGAVKVANGQTAWAATDFASKRNFLSPKGDVQNEWIVDYPAVVSSGAVGIIPRGIRVASTGSLIIQGTVYVV